MRYFISKKVVKKEGQEVYKHYFINKKAIKEEIVIQETHKFNSALWIPWYYALEYFDNEDNIAVTLYFDQFKGKA